MVIAIVCLREIIFSAEKCRNGRFHPGDFMIFPLMHSDLSLASVSIQPTMSPLSTISVFCMLLGLNSFTTQSNPNSSTFSNWVHQFIRKMRKKESATRRSYRQTPPLATWSHSAYRVIANFSPSLKVPQSKPNFEKRNPLQMHWTRISNLTLSSGRQPTRLPCSNAESYWCQTTNQARFGFHAFSGFNEFW